MPERKPAPTECANCGAEIPRGAQACPECGADERTGWRESSLYDGLDLPDDAYAENKNADGPPAPSSPRINGVRWYWWLAGALVLLLFVAATFGLR